MSIAVIDAVIHAETPLTAHETLVLVVLASYANDVGARCWPSQETIARKARLKGGIRSVRYLVKRLTDKGILRIVPAVGRRSIRYEIQLHALGQAGRKEEVGSSLRRKEELGSSLHRKEELGSSQASAHALRREEVGTRREELGSSDPLDPDQDQDQDQPAAPVHAQALPAESPPFAVYAAIGTRAVNDALGQRIPLTDVGALAEIFKTLCARQDKPYNGRTATKAIDAAIMARENSIRRVLAQRRQHPIARRA